MHVNHNAAAPHGTPAVETGAPLLSCSARDMLRALSTGATSAKALLQLHFDRVDALNPVLNIVVDQDRERALADAMAIDAARLRGEPLGPLAGLPMTVKDSFEVAGMMATCGMPALTAHSPATDAVAVARLRRAGAVIYGKTNVPFACSDHQSYNDVYGTTRNPWDPSLTPGGSSGGSAASLAAGFSALELGSDIGGSIRCPAHFCGVFGHKPTYASISSVGHIPPAPHATAPSELSVIGPLARDPYDLEIALDVLLAGEAGVPGPARHDSLKAFRVGVWTDAYPVDEGYLRAIEHFVDDLRRIGVRVVEARPALDVVHSRDVYLRTLFGVIGSRMPAPAKAAFDALARCSVPPAYAADIARYVHENGHLLDAVARDRAALQHEWARFFSSFDVLICPVTTTAAFAHDQAFGHGPAAQLSRVLDVSGKPRPYIENLLWPGLVSVANLPATAVPTGHFVGTVPVGVQIVGPWREDRTPLRFAQLISERLPLFRAAPLAF